jgi:hypothetical protein
MSALHGVMAEFASDEAMVDALRAARAAGWRRMDAFAPFPVAEAAELLGATGNRVAWIAIGAGLVGAALAYGTQYWLSVHDYPINVGGRPLHAWPAFLPATTIVAILWAAAASLLGHARAQPAARLVAPGLRAPGFLRASEDRFFLLLSAADPRFGAEPATRFLEPGRCASRGAGGEAPSAASRCCSRSDGCRPARPRRAGTAAAGSVARGDGARLAALAPRPRRCLRRDGREAGALSDLLHGLATAQAAGRRATWWQRAFRGPAPHRGADPARSMAGGRHEPGGRASLRRPDRPARPLGHRAFRRGPAARGGAALTRAVLILVTLAALAAALLRPPALLEAWLTPFLALAGLSAGAIGALAIGHLLREDWLQPVREPLEAMARTAPLVAVMACPCSPRPISSTPGRAPPRRPCRRRAPPGSRPGRSACARRRSSGSGSGWPGDWAGPGRRTSAWLPPLSPSWRPR